MDPEPCNEQVPLPRKYERIVKQVQSKYDKALRELEAGSETLLQSVEKLKAEVEVVREDNKAEVKALLARPKHDHEAYKGKIASQKFESSFLYSSALPDPSQCLGIKACSENRLSLPIRV